jgi:hypothetical protein
MNAAHKADKNDARPEPLRSPPTKKDSGDDMRDSPSALTLFLAMLALVVMGYFLCMKMIDMSRNEECLMSSRHNCATLTDSNSE